MSVASAENWTTSATESDASVNLDDARKNGRRWSSSGAGPSDVKNIVIDIDGSSTTNGGTGTGTGLIPA